VHTSARLCQRRIRSTRQEAFRLRDRATAARLWRGARLLIFGIECANETRIARHVYVWLIAHLALRDVSVNDGWALAQVGAGWQVVARGKVGGIIKDVLAVAQQTLQCYALRSVNFLKTFCLNENFMVARLRPVTAIAVSLARCLNILFPSTIFIFEILLEIVTSAGLRGPHIGRISALLALVLELRLVRRHEGKEAIHVSVHLVGVTASEASCGWHLAIIPIANQCCKCITMLRGIVALGLLL